MKKNKFLIISIMIFILLLSFIIAFAQETFPNPTKEFYVNDYVNILSQETKSLIINTNLNYEKTTEKPQVVIAIIPNLQGFDIQSYTTKLFEKWKIGNKDFNNGVLVLLAMKEKKIRVEVGYGLEGTLPDGKIGEFLDLIKKDLSSNNFSKGITNIFYLISKEVNKEYKYDDEKIFSETNNFNFNENNNRNINKNPISKFIFILAILIFIFIDFKFMGGFLTGILLNSVMYSNRSDYDNSSSGEGGRSGGGGSDRDF